MQSHSMQVDVVAPRPRNDLDVQKLESNRRMLRVWLRVVLFTLFCIVIVGGATRLTESGLSITEWKPIHGAIPPLSVEEWQEEFDLYKRIPQYQEINKGMSLEEFKVIFWWEWAHRQLARAIGVIFAVPLAFFWATGRVEKQLRAPLIGLLALGGLQGFIGWWMVSSGLSVRTDVSQYRLAVHLTIACLIFAGCMWVLRALTPHSPNIDEDRAGMRTAGVLLALCLFQIYLGALVAGLSAGLAYNTWPLMDGALIPGDLFIQNPWWINLFENAKTVQFVHRVGAYALFALALVHWIKMMKVKPTVPADKRAGILFALITLQAIFGIVTLLTQVHIHIALVHQGMALVVLAFSIAHLRGFIGAYPYQAKA